MLAWQRICLDKSAAGYMADVANLQQRGHGKTSIWNMPKAELVEVARNELGMTLSQAHAETVLVLRKKIKSMRNMTAVAANPLAVLPKGLGCMSLEELAEETMRRGLPELPKPNQAALILQIRNDVGAHSLLLTHEMNAASLAAASMTDDDFEMVPSGFISPDRGDQQ